MRTLLNSLRYSARFFEADGLGSGGGGDTAPTPESILFPSESQPSETAGDTDDASTNADASGANAATDPAQAADDNSGDAGAAKATDAADWKEYVHDDTKTAEENAALKAAHDATKPKEADPLDTVPEDGKYVLTMPEGVQVNQRLLDDLSPTFKDLGLTTKQAQGLADKFAASEAAAAKARIEEWAATQAKWVADAKADKSMGGDNWSGTVTKAVKAINHFGTPDLKNYLDASGGGNHPELIRLMSKVGDLISEDNPPAGGGSGSGKPAEAAHLLFPNDAPKG
jgi:hypothetical protein